MQELTIAKFGGSTLGVNGSGIPVIIDRIKNLSKDDRKILAVFSAPLTEYNNKKRSLTDVALYIGEAYADNRLVDVEILRDVYIDIAKKYMKDQYREEFFNILEELYKQVLIALKQAMEYKRFVDVIRARVLAYSGEIAISYAMKYILKSNGVKADNVSIDEWPIITDDNFEAANFLYNESKERLDGLLALIDENDIVTIGGFIGRTIDGLETTYERGGSDRTAADLAILLNDTYDVSIDLEKDGAVLSADPKIVDKDLEHIDYLSYNEAILAGMFGMKILDPIAIKEIEEFDLNIPIVITDINNPSKRTLIKKESKDSKNPLKIVTGRKSCAIVKVRSDNAWHLLASLRKERRYSEFVILSPYIVDDTDISRILFLDGIYVRRNERYIKAYDKDAILTYNRGAITLIGDNMARIPNIASIASSTVGENDINILNMDAQEETSRILIIVEDKNENVENAIRAIHAKRKGIITL
ncbi:MAG: aspartate kinase [Candidatus Nitrosothermus koennekii]|nr:MAG: aspartate kinase [Candidatus Nitrosothermus koennekii]